MIKIGKLSVDALVELLGYHRLSVCLMADVFDDLRDLGRIERLSNRRLFHLLRKTGVLCSEATNRYTPTKAYRKWFVVSEDDGMALLKVSSLADFLSLLKIHSSENDDESNEF